MNARSTQALLAAALLMSMFCVGFVAGQVFERARPGAPHGPPPPHPPPGPPGPPGPPPLGPEPALVANRMRQALELDDAQVEKVRTILQESRDELSRVRERVEPEMTAIRERTRARIREVLTPEQREKHGAALEHLAAPPGRGPPPGMGPPGMGHPPPPHHPEPPGPPP